MNVRLQTWAIFFFLQWSVWFNMYQAEKKKQNFVNYVNYDISAP